MCVCVCVCLMKTYTMILGTAELQRNCIDNWSPMSILFYKKYAWHHRWSRCLDVEKVCLWKKLIAHKKKFHNLFSELSVVKQRIKGDSSVICLIHVFNYHPTSWIGLPGSRFQDSVAKNRYWPVEIFRLPQPSGGKGKKVTVCELNAKGFFTLHHLPFLLSSVK